MPPKPSPWNPPEAGRPPPPPPDPMAPRFGLFVSLERGAGQTTSYLRSRSSLHLVAPAANERQICGFGYFTITNREEHIMALYDHVAAHTKLHAHIFLETPCMTQW